jgi:hypothetical protein
MYAACNHRVQGHFLTNFVTEFLVLTVLSQGKDSCLPALAERLREFRLAPLVGSRGISIAQSELS